MQSFCCTLVPDVITHRSQWTFKQTWTRRALSFEGHTWTALGPSYLDRLTNLEIITGSDLSHLSVLRASSHRRSQRAPFGHMTDFRHSQHGRSARWRKDFARGNVSDRSSVRRVKYMRICFNHTHPLEWVSRDAPGERQKGNEESSRETLER